MGVDDLPTVVEVVGEFGLGERALTCVGDVEDEDFDLLHFFLGGGNVRVIGVFGEDGLLLGLHNVSQEILEVFKFLDLRVCKIKYLT